MISVSNEKSFPHSGSARMVQAHINRAGLETRREKLKNEEIGKGEKKICLTDATKVTSIKIATDQTIKQQFCFRDQLNS